MPQVPREGDVSRDGLRVRTRMSGVARCGYVIGAGVSLVLMVALIYAAVVQGADERVWAVLCALIYFPFALFFLWNAVFPFDWLDQAEIGERAASKGEWTAAKAEWTELFTKEGREAALEAISAFAGGCAALVAFVGVYVAAVSSVGWVIGIALGWIPAMLAALLAGFVVYVAFRFFWMIILLGGLVFIASVYK